MQVCQRNKVAKILCLMLEIISHIRHDLSCSVRLEMI